jgi:YidC/Oxa1 family membrane protein insertase
MKEEQRVFLAFILALFVIILFSFNQQKQRQVPVPQQPERIASETEFHPVAAGTGESVSAETVVFSGQTISFGNDLYSGEIDPLGGKIVSFGLLQYRRPGEKIFSFFDHGTFLSDAFPDRSEEILYTNGHAEAGNASLVGKCEGLELIKVLGVTKGKYTWDFAFIIKNNAKEAAQLHQITLSLGTYALGHSQDQGIPEILILHGTGAPAKVNPARILKEKIVGTTAIMRTRFQMYCFTFSAPVEFLVENTGTRHSPSFAIRAVLPDATLAPGSTQTFNIKGYIGPSDYFIARSEISDLRVYGTGPFAAMGRILFRWLQGIHKVIPNWGWAIIFLTLLIKLAFFPLTRNGLRSMKNLQKLRPYLQDIQKKYKENPQMMQKEMMALYKEYKINPLGGCLPSLIQFPIFIGFFLALRNSVYLRGSHFALWIRDLSMPDTVAHAGPIPINLLPIVMFVTSFFQQKMMPQPEEQQKMLNYLLPIFMLYIFYNFSSGLLLYWVTMNIAGLIEQYYIAKKT